MIGFSETLIFELPHALERPDSFVGVLMAVQGVGAVAGALTATWSRLSWLRPQASSC